MIVVAGPPGSGKSTAFPLSQFGIDYFNADDMAADLNGGSYINISPAIREEANKRMESFIDSHIRDSKSFAIEATLRTMITFKQARRARRQGFLLIMFYIAVDKASLALERVANRADMGGHSANSTLLRRSYYSSLWHLPIAIREFDHIAVFDNTAVASEPSLLLQASQGAMYDIAPEPPQWLAKAIHRVLVPPQYKRAKGVGH